MHHLGFTYSDARDLQIPIRRWFVERINKQLSDSAAQGSTDTRSFEANTPDLRAARGSSRHVVPARLRHTS